jgi:threonine aldolase
VAIERDFASDNSSGVHPAVLEAITAANVGHAAGYGEDEYTQRVARQVAAEFGERARVLFVWGGSGANVLCLRAACRPWQAVLCSQMAHINVDEGGAPEAIGGLKLLSAPAADGRLASPQVARLIARLGDEHAVQPGVVSLTQSTEVGTVYSPAQIAEIAALAHDRGLVVHIDGARLANAAAFLGVSLRALTTEVGADIVSFGGTKNGLLGAEAVVLLDERLADGILYLRKQTLQLASKMRFLAAQFDALMGDQLWLRNARHANAMATRLAGALAGAPGVRVTHPVHSNAVFATLPEHALAELHRRFSFHTWDETIGEARWMCSWDTTEDDVDALAGAVLDLVGHPLPVS